MKNGQKKKAWLVTLFILQIITCYSLSLFSVIGSILLPFFFFLVYAKDDVTPFHKLLGAFLWSFCSFLFHMQLPSIWEIGLLISYTLLTLWITSFNRNQQTMRLLTVTAIGIVSFLFIPIFPYVRNIIAYMMQWISLGVGYMLNPLFLWAQLKPTDDSWKSKLSKGESPPLPIPEKGYNPLILQSIAILIIVIIAIYVIWKLFKNRHEIRFGRIASYESIIVASEQGRMQKRSKRLRPPKNAIRKEIFNLEKKLKPPLNRLRGETVEQWMERLHRVEQVSIQFDVIINAYNATRYANHDDTELLQKFKREVHTLYKNRKSVKEKKNKLEPQYY